jgi:hypothetical protein
LAYLEPISSGAGQHLVDAQHVERVHPDADVELILGRVLHHVLKARKSFGRQNACRNWGEKAVHKKIRIRKKLEYC